MVSESVDPWTQGCSHISLTALGAVRNSAEQSLRWCKYILLRGQVSLRGLCPHIFISPKAFPTCSGFFQLRAYPFSCLPSSLPSWLSISVQPSHPWGIGPSLPMTWSVFSFMAGLVPCASLAAKTRLWFTRVNSVNGCEPRWTLAP